MSRSRLAMFGAVLALAACGGGGTTDDAPDGAAAGAAAPGDPSEAPDADGAQPVDGGTDPTDGATGGDGSSDAADAADAGADAGDAASDSGVVVPNDDPFDPASCGGAVLTSANALAMLGAAPRKKLADATLMRRTRACTGPTPETCGPWGAPVPHTQALLTYSGGVVTDYKTFSFPTHLVLFNAAGQPKMSIRHASDYTHDATASTRGVVFAFGADPMVNTYPIIYVWDFAPAPNRYEDLQGLLGTKGELYAREACARVVFTNGVTTEIAALYRY